ncbi:hypothetical protein JOF35_008705 [Streptomyces demainii]|uniref:Uncharacterized protein n=1 Tax=Streptomyces demainii TaxID=588122 RepID=A0ABT9L6M4_9ACTN|nr:hypothetical protein [Streptomyces demainii]MDP9616367.1 hypothetical protein [Streptomyces demainii]
MDTDLGAAQHGAPDTCEDLLDRGARGDVGRVAAELLLGGRGKGSPVEFAVGAQRHLVQPHERRGHHVRREVGLELAAHIGDQVGRIGLVRRLGVEREIGDEPLFTGGGRVGDDDGVVDGRVGAQRRLDLAELDPEAPDLHLVVHPAEDLEGAVGAAAGEITGAVEPGARLTAQGIRHEALRRQTGPAVVAATQ